MKGSGPAETMRLEQNDQAAVSSESLAGSDEGRGYLGGMVAIVVKDLKRAVGVFQLKAPFCTAKGFECFRNLGKRNPQVRRQRDDQKCIVVDLKLLNWDTDTKSCF